MKKVTIQDINFEINNNTGYSDKTVGKHFESSMLNTFGDAESIKDCQGTKFSAFNSTMKGEKISFIPSI